MIKRALTDTVAIHCSATPPTMDIGVEKIAEEFTDVRKTAKVLDTVFTLTGLKYIDSLGKESLVNSTIEKYRKYRR